ncbi:MAG: patatin-like phospholipase family protein [Bauldia litoralis]
MAALVALAACQGLPKIPDQRAGATPAGPTYRFADLSRAKGNTDGLLVLIAFSGGGVRASAMAYGVLEALHATRIGRGAQRRTLLSEVDVISGTSGGSFTAAYYGLHRERMFARGPNGLTPFERRYLKRPVTSDLKSTVFSNLIRINTGATNRSDVAAELYEETIFGKRTYRDLLRAGRPLIAINANDTTKLSQFVFTQDQFDLICGDLASYPVARAVTASSAVHGVFAPIKLRNFAPRNRNCPTEPAWVAAALRGDPQVSTAVETPRDRRRLARLARWYRNGEPYGRTAVPDARYWVHLADGGSIDNVALRPILGALGSPISRWGIRELIASGRVRRVLLIVVNAQKRPDRDTDRRPEGPTLVRMLFSAMNSAQNATSRDSLRTAETLFADLRRRHPRTAFDGPVVVELDAIRNPARRRCFRNIATALDLPADQVDALRQEAAMQLEADPRYRAFLKATGGTRTGDLSFPGAAGFCKQG